MAISASYPIPEDMRTTINACAAGLGAVGVIGGLVGPGTDLVAIVPTWVGMVGTLAGQAGTSMDSQTAKKICVAAAMGVGTFVLGTKVASTIGGWLLAPFTGGLSLAANVAANVALNAALTRYFGCAVARYFLQTHKIEDLDVTVKILIALVGLDFGIASPIPDVTA
jgi:hypothetical protein